MNMFMWIVIIIMIIIVDEMNWKTSFQSHVHICRWFSNFPIVRPLRSHIMFQCWVGMTTFNLDFDCSDERI